MENTEVSRQVMDVDLACVGFGPAMAGFLSTLCKAYSEDPTAAAFQSKSMPGAPLQVMCYERADDLGFGISGVVSRARSIRQSYSLDELRQVPMAQPVTSEELVYLLDPHGASRRPWALRCLDGVLRGIGKIFPLRDHSFTLPLVPPFLHKVDGFIFSLGQLQQWVAGQLMGTGLVQIWPGMPVAQPIIEGGAVKGIQLADQGVTKAGEPDACFMPGMEVRAPLTVVGDGPVGAVGQKLNEHFGFPAGHQQRDWAVGMKVVVELPESCTLKPGTVLHTFGYPEPEIFGFLYVHGDRLASAGIFVPSWFDSPVRTSYRYLQHWLTHPYLWRHLEGGEIKSWGAKSLLESGKEGEPHLVGAGYARIGEGSGTTNVLTGSGVDEAWASGAQLADAVVELLQAGKELSQENLSSTYLTRRRASVYEREARVAEKSRHGFQAGFVQGMLGMGLSWATGGAFSLGFAPKRPWDRVPSFEEYFGSRIPSAELRDIRAQCAKSGEAVHDKIMDRLGWPKIKCDGKLLVSHQDALLVGGKVQAPAGFADHVEFVDKGLCEKCRARVCIELCSAQAISAGEHGLPQFDREKCIHCGACFWNCAQADAQNPELGNIRFKAGAGGAHSNIN